ncbi:MAG: nicotinate-nucleotide--dimethylbenzimidazole phosphoribosyltransferase [Pseudomonadales bacterium]|jgi:nicotinate-nucleotide--dimethylbenzimidazole phosphoribosyltransferase
MTDWLSQPIQALRVERLDQALAHQNQLTKPPGSMGRMEELAVLLCALQDTLTPSLDRVAIRVFAADHGVVAEGVSAFPQEVTVEMIRNFAHGGAAISVLAQAQQADFAVVNMGTAVPAPTHDKVMQNSLGPGTHNFCEQPAMSREQLEAGLRAGYDIAEQLYRQQCQLFIGGEMGIGNTTTAAALACALAGDSPENLVGTGTGVDAAGLVRKTEVVKRALAFHQNELTDPLDCLQRLGGFEIVALTGVYLRCAQLGIPSLVDGFICSVAALAALQLNQGCQDWLLFSHQSAERGHARVLEVLKAEPLLNLKMRLGEGSGAAVALPLLKLACELHNKMATFESAGVSK